MYSVGQADSLLTAGSVSMPKYYNGSLEENQYPCSYSRVDLSKRPEQIPLGFYDDINNSAYPEDIYSSEPYVKETQHQKAGKIEDVHIFAVVLILLVLVIAGVLMYND
jgi:hypothetical protein